MDQSTNLDVEHGGRLWDYAAHAHDVIGTRSLGFWLYLMSDAMIFVAWFAAWAVYMHASAGGPTLAQVVHPDAALLQTLILFASVLAYGLGMVALKHGRRGGVLAGLSVSLVLGAVFLVLEAQDFSALAAIGALPQRSGFLSEYWLIVLAHALHMLFGLLWMLVMIVQVAALGFRESVVARLVNLKLFWHFQALVWVCVLCFIMLPGVLR
jgi:cytochrome o ubiquinol oxidase subunit 3